MTRSIKLFIQAGIWLGAVNAVAVNVDPTTPLRSFEIQTSHAGKGEFLILEEMNLNKQPTYFLKQRRGKRTVAVTTVPKQRFDVWSKSFINKTQLTKKQSCPQPINLVKTQKGKKEVIRFCMNQIERKALASMGSTIKEMQTFVTKNDATKGRYRQPARKK